MGLAMLHLAIFGITVDKERKILLNKFLWTEQNTQKQNVNIQIIVISTNS